MKTVVFLLCVILAQVTPTLAQDATLAQARGDTLEALQWLLEAERLDCRASVDSLTAEVRWRDLALANIEPESSERPHPILAAIGSKTAVFCYGFTIGAWLSVEIMRAVD